MHPVKALKKGDTVALLAPSSPPGSPETPEKSAAVLEELGFRVKIYPSCRARYGYLAGTDEVRAADLNAAFADDGIAGVVCMMGGYGTPRILDRLDYGMIAKHPKLFMGYSDITALHIAFNQLAELPTFHSPMPFEFANGKNAFSWEHFAEVLTGRKRAGEICNPAGMPAETLVGGKAKGRIAGGNLCLIVAALGSKYEIDTKGKLLFMEDVEEDPYRIDRMLTQLRLAGKFEDCAGILIGQWQNCVPRRPEPSLSISQVLADVVVPAGKPTLCNLMIGHSPENATVPLGAEAEMDADGKTLRILEDVFVG